MYFKTCKYCGAYPDPGEICDCKKEETAPVQREQSQARAIMYDIKIISSDLRPVKPGGRAYG